MSHLYASIGDVRDRGVSFDDATNAQVLTALERATRMIDAFSGRDFRARDRLLRVDGSGGASLFLDDRPIILVREVLVDGVPLSAADYVVYAEEGYVKLVGGRTIFAGFPGTFPAGSQNIEVTGLFGYLQPPAEVKESAILLAIEFLRTGPAEADIAAGSGESTRNAIGISRVKIDEISVDFQYPSDLKSGSGGALTTGLLKVDGLLTRFQRDLRAAVV